MSIEATLQQFLERELLDPDTTVRWTENLLEGELINSIAALQLAGFIDETFGMEVGAEDFTVENFATINDLAALVRRKREGS